MTRFFSIIQELREKRKELLDESKKRRLKGAPRKKRARVKKLEFDSKMLEEIFNGMPLDMQEHLKRKI